MNTCSKFHDGYLALTEKPIEVFIFGFLKNNFLLYPLTVFVHIDIELIFTVGGKLSDRMSRVCSRLYVVLAVK